MEKENIKIVSSIKNNSIIMRDKFCWVCGKKFNKKINKDKRTYHHAFSKRWNVVTNIQLPVCDECHRKINKEDEVFKKAYSMLKGIFKITEKIIEKKKSDFVSNNNQLNKKEVEQ